VPVDTAHDATQLTPDDPNWSTLEATNKPADVPAVGPAHEAAHGPALATTHAAAHRSTIKAAD